MQITVLNATKTQATSKAGKPYTYLELAYKGSDGQVKGKKVMPFGESKVVFDSLATAGSGEFFDIEAIKNEASGYWDWVSAKKSDGSAATQSTATDAPAAGGRVMVNTRETAEERAKKQVYIVRQSSITAALSYIGDTKKVSIAEVLAVAKQFEEHVFYIPKVEVATTIKAIDASFESDIPL